MMEISDLWSSPFAIDKHTRIATYGSCFAQHFSRALTARGYSWLNAETAPGGLSSETARRFGYGVFSSRTGNIYTASLLLQWVEWALGIAKPPPLHWTKGDRVFDPFRPTIEPDGFGSTDEMLASRGHAIAAFRGSLLDCDLLVFTLGLTESWWDSTEQVEFAICPGTHAGTFDGTRHVFLNQDYGFVRERLERAIGLVRQARGDDLGVLLTVSPVPLVATNSGGHVLVATMGSKSILRAVAGSVASGLPRVSYFPSYEIINSPAFRGRFFEENLRSVNVTGVDHVMNSFFAGLTPASGASGEAPRTSAASPEQETSSADDMQCDEELLAAFGNAK